MLRKQARLGRTTWTACTLTIAVLILSVAGLLLQKDAKDSAFSATVQLERFGEVTVGVTRADGQKCSRYRLGKSNAMHAKLSARSRSASTPSAASCNHLIHFVRNPA